MKKKTFYVLSRENEFQKFDNLENLVIWAVKNLRLIGHNWNDTYPCERFAYCKHEEYAGLHPIQYLVMDEFHRIIDVIELVKETKIIKKKSSKNWRDGYYVNSNKANWLGFRNGPVSGTRKYRLGKRSFRCPRTTQELRRNELEKEYMRHRELPNAWDEILIGKHNFCRSWKNQKIRKQWEKRL